MRFLIHLVTESEAGQRVQEIACLERKEPRLENVGLSLRQRAKQLVGRHPGHRSSSGKMADYLEIRRPCPRCGEDPRPEWQPSR